MKVQPKFDTPQVRDTSMYDGDLEVRIGVPELREDGNFPKIRGYAAMFNQLSQPLLFGMRERIRPGAFRATIANGADVRALFNHDPSQILGRNKAGTLKLEEDNIGLRYVIDPPNTTVGRDVVENIRRGDVTQSSFGFRSVDEEYKKENGQWVRELVSVELFDVSPVTYPAYTGTSVGVRCIHPMVENAEMRTAVEGFYRDLRRTIDPPYVASPEHLEKLRRRRLTLLGAVIEKNEAEMRASQKIQTIIFSKDDWTVARARKWVTDHGFKDKGVDETSTSYRFRQFDPGQCNGSFETLTQNMPKGVRMVACKS